MTLRMSLAAVLLAIAASVAVVPDCLAAAPCSGHCTPVSMDQAVRMAEHRFRARVVRADSQQNSGRTIYVLRMLNDSGRVWTVRVDAASGAVL